VTATVTGTPVTVAALANDGDPDGDALGVVGVSQGRSGIVTHSGGSVTYTPKAGFLGVDVFTYTVIDGHGGSAVGAIAVNVVAPDSPLALPPAPDSGASTAVVAAGADPAPSGGAAAKGGCSSAGAGASAPLLLVMAALLAARRRRRA
jgi:MYXO-CTERM domain-containing protein